MKTKSRDMSVGDILEDFFGAMAASEEHPTTESQPQDDAAER